MNKTFLFVRAEYYHYNADMDDNCARTISLTVKNIKEANEIKESIDKCTSENELDGQANTDILHDDGYFTSKAWIVEVIEKIIN